MASRTFTTHPIVLRRLEVARVVDVTPRMRRVTLTGLQLSEFERDGLVLQPFESTGFDDHVKLIFASDGDIAGALPVQLAETIDWPESSNRLMRDYTPRRVDLTKGEVDLDFVLHGEGPAASWAQSVAVGDDLHMAGPKSSLILPDEIDWVLLAGDETALPAIGRYLDERNDAIPVQIVIEIEHEDAIQELAVRDGDTIRWVVNGVGLTTPLATAVQEVEWWDGAPYAWAAAESASLLPLRRWLARQKNIPKTHVNITGYWHTVTAKADVADVPMDANSLLSPVAWFATRAALSLGLLDAVADRPSTVREMAQSHGIDQGATRTLVDYLLSIDVLGWADEAAGLLLLGGVGEHVLGDEHLRGSLEDSLESRTIWALGELAQAATQGTSAYVRQHGRSLREDIDSSLDFASEKLADVVGFDFVVRGVLALPQVIEAKSVLTTGFGSVALVGALAQGRTVTVFDSPVVLEAIRLNLADDAIDLTTQLGQADLLICALALVSRTDSQAISLLRDFTAVSDRALVIEEIDGPGLGTAHVTEHRLVDLAATGVSIRGIDEIARIAEAAGWDVTRTSTLGWNYEVFELTRAV